MSLFDITGLRKTARKIEKSGGRSIARRIPLNQGFAINVTVRGIPGFFKV